MKGLKTLSQALFGFSLLFVIYELVYNGVARASVEVRSLKDFLTWYDPTLLTTVKGILDTIMPMKLENFFMNAYAPLILVFFSGVVYILFYISMLISGKDKSHRI